MQTLERVESLRESKYIVRKSAPDRNSVVTWFRHPTKSCFPRFVPRHVVVSMPRLPVPNHVKKRHAGRGLGPLPYYFLLLCIYYLRQHFFTVAHHLADSIAAYTTWHAYDFCFTKQPVGLLVLSNWWKWWLKFCKNGCSGGFPRYYG